MRRYLAHRLLALVPVWVGITVLAFGLGNLAPGDPATLALGRTGEPPRAEELAAIRAQLGLDDPLPIRYARWLVNVLGGDLGRSYRGGGPVLQTLLGSFPTTMALAAGALLVSLAIALPLGVASAVWHGSLVDHAARAAALLGTSLPSFCLAYLLIVLLSVELRLLPVAGADTWRHAILPALTLGLGGSAVLTRMTRSAMLEVLGDDFVRTARAKGLPERRVLLTHAFRNALVPLVTLSGLKLGYLMAGAVIVETIFSWPGIGKLAVDAILDRDYPLMQGFVLFTGTVFVLVNLLVDLAYVRLDPRIRLAESGGGARGPA